MILRQLYNLSESYPQNVYLNTVQRTYGTINRLQTSRAIKDNFKRFINAVYNELGILLLAYSGQRDYPEQWELRKKYLAGGHRAALPGWSWHNFGRALDVVPVTTTGQADWNTRKWAAIHKIAKRFGLENGLTYGDPGHILDRKDTTLATQRAIKPGWQLYEILEKEKKVMKPKDTESPRQFKIGKGLLYGGLAAGAVIGGVYLYKRYARN